MSCVQAIRDRGYEDHFYRIFPSLRPPVPVSTARNAFLKQHTQVIAELKELERLSNVPKTKLLRLHDLKDRRFANSITFSAKVLGSIARPPPPRRANPIIQSHVRVCVFVCVRDVASWSSQSVPRAARGDARYLPA